VWRLKILACEKVFVGVGKSFFLQLNRCVVIADKKERGMAICLTAIFFLVSSAMSA
jgi:hypothetical protein